MNFTPEQTAKLQLILNLFNTNRDSEARASLKELVNELNTANEALRNTYANELRNDPVFGNPPKDVMKFIAEIDKKYPKIDFVSEIAKKLQTMGIKEGAVLELASDTEVGTAAPGSSPGWVKRVIQKNLLRRVDAYEKDAKGNYNHKGGFSIPKDIIGDDVKLEQFFATVYQLDALGEVSAAQETEAISLLTKENFLDGNGDLRPNRYANGWVRTDGKLVFYMYKLDCVPQYSACGFVYIF